MIAILGDIHYEFRILFRGMVSNSHKDVTAWVQVGDLGAEKKSYPDFPAPTYFISGNHENWDEIEKIDAGKGPKNLFHIKNGEMVTIEGINILGFGGNFSPRWYPEDSSKIPPTRRKHFLLSQYETAISHKDVDVLITHEAPSPYVRRNQDIGQYVITDLLREVKPRLHFFGHHHYSGDYIYEGIPSYGLAKGFKDFVKLDPKTFKLKRCPL